MLSRTPIQILYALTASVTWVMRRVVRHRIETVRTNIERSFPDLPPQAQRQIENGYYANLSQTLAEMIRIGGLTEDELRQRVRFDNPEVIRDVITAGRSALLVCAHQCNWEWLLLALSAQLHIPVQAAYKPLHGAYGEKLMRSLRTRFGADLVPAKQLLSNLLKRRDPRAVAMVADQAPVTSDFKHWTQFLGRPTAFYMGPEKIAQASRFAVIFIGMRRTARGHYEIICEPLAAAGERLAAGEITERYARAVERQILAAPADWLWSHRRWKLPPPQGVA